jgi:hypothetical protein
MSENLHPNLQRYVIDHPIFGRVIDHPLYRMDLGRPDATIEKANQEYAICQLCADEAYKENDWHCFLVLHQRRFRVAALYELAIEWDFEFVSKLWKCLGYVWKDTESIWANTKIWRELWSMDGRKSAMTPYERGYLAKQPESLTVFRGVPSEEFAAGISWTLDRRKAEWFARRWRGNAPVIIEGQVASADVIAYFTSRNEREVVALPEDVKVKSVSKI